MSTMTCYCFRSVSEESRSSGFTPTSPAGLLVLYCSNQTSYAVFDSLELIVLLFHTNCSYYGPQSKLRSEPNKNLAIANRSRVSCINTNYTMTLKSGLEVTQGH